MLEFDELSRSFGDVVALDRLSFSVEPGKMFGFLGPNGAGKTTAMRVVMGVERADAGVVRWRGAPVIDAVRLRFGYMPEERGLYPRMRARDQLVFIGRAYGLSETKAGSSADSWLDRFGLTERSGDRVEQLSLGNQQRVQLAAALVHDPELFVLDEPFSGLDPIGVADLGEVLSERVAAGASVLFSSHQLDLVEHMCDSVAIIDRGRVVMSGAVDELKADAGSRKLVVTVEDTESTWTEDLRDVEVAERQGSTVRLILGEHADAQDVLAAARRAGPVTHFSFERPRLSELFMEAVGR